MRHKDIATLIPGQKSGKGISVVTLHRHFRVELDRGMAQADVQVVRSLFEKAIGNGPAAVRAAIWWAKTRMGWGQRASTNITANRGGSVVIAPANLAPHEWIRQQSRAGSQP